MNYQPKNILITGSAGFIGANFVCYALDFDANTRLISLDKLTYAGKKENLPEDDRHIFVKGDILDCALINRLLKEYEIDTIVHFAAESHVDRSISGPSVFLETNVLGTFTLLEAARAYWLGEKGWDETKCRFHHISTDEVFGQLKEKDPAFSETTPYDPSSPYSASKASSDHFVRAFHHTYGLPITLSNCSNNYGPFQHDEKLIPTVIRNCVNQSAIPVYGNGSNIRDWLYVEDHCSAIMRVVTKAKTGESYNIGGNCELDNLTLVKTICALMDELRPIEGKHEDLITFVKDRAGHDWRYAIDNTKIKEELSWEPEFQFKEALRKTVQFCLEK